jgi:hypothetical protein
VTVARRRLAIAAGVIVFLAITVVITRGLAADSDERARVERLLTAQARGDAAAMARELDGCDTSCAGRLDRLATRLKAPGDLEIIRYDSHTAHALSATTGPTRVVWRIGDGLPTVQCVRVRRTGSVLTGPAVTLLGLTAPIGREAGC